MRYLSKFRSLSSNSTYKLDEFHPFQPQIFNLSTFSRPSKSKRTQKQTPMKNDRESNKFSSLFTEITEILGANDLTHDQTSTGFSILEKNQQPHLIKNELNEEHSVCSLGVCANFEQSVSENESKHFENLNNKDVSPIVHTITEIVRGESGVNSMEERLEKSGFLFDAEIVEMVLKRCFKVPRLGYRFFYWVKDKDGFCHTTETYNTMMYMAVDAKEYWLVDKLLEEMEMSACKRDNKTWTILLSRHGKAGSAGKALMVFEEMRKSGCETDSRSYKMMVCLLCTAQKSNIAMEFYKEMVAREWGLDINSYKLLMNCLARAGNTSLVQLVANDMIRISLIPEQIVYISMLKSFFISGNMKEALELIRDFKKRNLVIDYESYETIVKGLSKADRIGDAMEIINIMKKEHVVNGKVYETIINGYLRKNNISEAVELFQSMKESGVSPTTITYTELMQHFFKSQEYHKGHNLYYEMLKNGVKLDTVAMTAVVAGHVCQDHINEAWEVFTDMEEKGIKLTYKFYFIFVKELCKVSRFDEVFKVIDRMLASNIVVGEDFFHWVASYMVRKGVDDTFVQRVKAKQSIIYSQFNRDQSTLKLNPYGEESSTSDFPETNQPNAVRPKTHHPNVEQSKTHEPNIERLKTHQPNVERSMVGQDSVTPLSPQAYNEQDLIEVCNILSSNKDWRLIQEALEKCAVEFTPELVIQILRRSNLNGVLDFFSWLGKKRDGYKHSTEAYNMAMKLAGSGKDYKHMRDLFSEMRRNRCLITPNTWTIMIMQYGRAGMTEIALKIFKEMKSNGYTPTGSTYTYLILCLCGRKGRKVDEAIKNFQEMFRSSHIPDKELVQTYLYCLCEENMLFEAKQCVKLLRKAGFSVPLSYSLYARALIRAGKLDEVSPLLDEVGEEKSKLGQYIYGSFVHGLLRKGQYDQAVEKMEGMKQIGIYPTVYVYTPFIVHHFKEKQVESALKIFNKMQDEGCEPTIVTYSAMIRGYMDNERIDEAMTVFHKIKQQGPMPDFQTYSMLIASLCKVGKSEDGLKLLIEMMDKGIVPSTINFRSVIFGLNREGKHDLARRVMYCKSDLKNKRKFLR